MKKKMRRLVSFTMAVFLVLSLLPTSVLAEETAEQTSTETNMAYFSTDMEQVLGEGKIAGSVTRKPVYAEKDNGYYTDVEEAIALLREKMVDRRSVIEIPLRVSKTEVSASDLQALIEGMFVLALAHTGVEDQGDYLLWSIADMGYNATYTETSSYYYLDIPYEFTYYTTLEQEVSVGRKLDSIFAGFGFTEQTDEYTKIKTIYDYICANVTYDYANLENDAYTLKYTAYAALNNGTAVCQGYATLLYRMLLRADIDCRVIAGVDNTSEAHAWNIVALDGAYYNMDSTWDAAGNNEYQYFLKGATDFPDHFRDAAYDIEEFHTVYPMADVAYVPGENLLPVSGTCGDGLTWTLTPDGILTISGNGAMDDYKDRTYTPWYDYRNYVLAVVVEAGVTHVGNYAFYNYPNLQAVSCAAATIGSCAFAENHAMLTLDLLEGIKEIGENAFAQCPGLTKIMIPEGVTRVASRAFSSTSTIKELHLPASIEQIEYQGVILEEVHITDLAAWCNIDFPAENANPLYNSAALYLNGQKVTHLVIPEGVTHIKDYAFPTYGGILQLTLPNSVVSVGEKAFYYSSITEVNWSKNLETIGTEAFMGAKLKKLDLPDSLQKIGTEAFACNWELTEISFGAGDLTIGWGGFSHCSGLEELTLPDCVKTIEYGAFSGCSKLKKVTIGSGLKVIPPSAFSSCYRLTDLMLGKNVERIEEDAFFQCTDLNRVVFPASLKELDRWIFRNCRNLDQIIFVGDAPQFDKNTLDDMRDYTRLTTILYPCTNPTWSEDVFQGYGHGTVQWLPNHVCENGKCTLCGEMEITLNGSCGSNVYWTLDVNGVLNVYGRGDISYSPLDAKEERASAVVIDVGITHITSKAFDRGYKNLETIFFKGDAPIFGEYVFNGLTATVYYPAGNSTWTEEVRQNYGGEITWVAACTAHSFENGVCTVCGEKDPDFKPDGLLGDADGSGVVDYVDAMLVLQYHTGVITNEALALAQCDVDGSGAVDYVDAMRILQYHTGVISGF